MEDLSCTDLQYFIGFVVHCHEMKGTMCHHNSRKGLTVKKSVFLYRYILLIFDREKDSRGVFCPGKYSFFVSFLENA
jgi:hypothetical protein